MDDNATACWRRLARVMMMVSMFIMVMYEKDVSGKRFQSQHDVSTDVFYCSAAVHFVNRVVKIRTVAGKMPSLDNRFFKRHEQA